MGYSIASISCSKSFGSVVGAKRFTVVPSLAMRNLVKFQRMSLSFLAVVLMPLRSVWVALAFSPLYSSVGACSLSQLKMGCSSVPLTSIFS